MSMHTDRRSFLAMLTAAFAAPVLLRSEVAAAVPVKAWVVPEPEFMRVAVVFADGVAVPFDSATLLYGPEFDEHTASGDHLQGRPVTTEVTLTREFRARSPYRTRDDVDRVLRQASLEMRTLVDKLRPREYFVLASRCVLRAHGVSAVMYPTHAEATFPMDPSRARPDDVVARIVMRARVTGEDAS